MTIVGLGVIVLLGIASCGGDGEVSQNPGTPAGITYTPGVYQPASTFAAQCQTPRTGTDPETNRPFVDQRGSTTAENHWLRSWTHDLYLWYREAPDVNPASVGSTGAYFEQMKTTAVLSSGQLKDKFHFTYNTAEWVALSGSGVSVGYGMYFAVLQTSPPRKATIQYVDSGSPAANAGVTRGYDLLTVDGVDFVNNGTTAGVNAINAALDPAASGESHTFVFRDRANTNRTVTLTARSVTANPVPVTSVLTDGADKLGYILFNDHNAPAEAALVSAINTLKTAAVQDLVLDLRYNGGGYLSIASQLAYMIAGPANTSGHVFERIQFNDQHPTTDPVTGQALAPTPFYTSTRGLSATSGQALPTLNLSRVFILTSNETCSASESIINGLRGVGVAVYQFGPDTCGKPYGFYPQDNCGTTYFSIQFKGVNELGFGDYFEGFSATRVGGDVQAKLPGCSANDDLTRDLGNPDEERLRVARVYRTTGLCTASATLGEKVEAAQVESGAAISIPPPPPWRTNRIMR